MTDHEQAAKDAARGFIDAFNARDQVALADTLNFPHTRLANVGEDGDRFRTIETPEDFIALGAAINAGLDREKWHHSVLVSCDVVHSGTDKVHLAQRVT